jgi:hypothetical protein
LVVVDEIHIVGEGKRAQWRYPTFMLLLNGTQSTNKKMKTTYKFFYLFFTRLTNSIRHHYPVNSLLKINLTTNNSFLLLLPPPYLKIFDPLTDGIHFRSFSILTVREWILLKWFGTFVAVATY